MSVQCSNSIFGVRQAVLQIFRSKIELEHSAVVAEDGVELLGDPDEGGPATQLLQFTCPDIGAGGANPTQDVSYSHIHGTFERNFHCLPLRRSGGKKKTCLL